MTESFAALMTQLASVDQLLEQDDFDPGALVGDIRHKVDQIKYILDRLEAYRAFLQEQMAPMEQAAVSAWKNATRLKDYLRLTMAEHNMEQVPGDIWRLKLQKNGQPALLFANDQPPTAEDFQVYPQFVKMVRYYDWNKEAVRKYLEDGGQLPFAHLEHGSHVRFYLNKEKVLDSASKRKS